jgi:hypothetical protein
MTTDFAREQLELDGFSGWIPFSQIREQDTVPRAGGVYVILRPSLEPPKFLEANPGGLFKGRDPTVTAHALRANWVDGAEVVYIGQANELRRRLRQFADFGASKPIGHWGGRLIWQLEDSDTFLVAWKQTPGQVPLGVETTLIAAFRGRYGRPPFANDPHRLGR